eukprot:206137_1
MTPFKTQWIFHVLLFISSTVSVDIPITCTTQFGISQSSISIVSCLAEEIMVSCGYNGADQIGGTIINATTNVCTAYEYSSSYGVQTEANITTTAIQSI